MEDTTTTDQVELDGTGAGLHEGIAVDAEGNALTQEQVQNLAQPEPTTEAAEAEPVDNSTEPRVESASNVDPDLIEWARKKGGIDTDDLTPGAVKALQLARDTERQFHADRQNQSELQRQLDQAQAYQQPYQYQPPAYQPPAQQVYDQYGQPVDMSAYQQPVMPQAPQIDPSIELLKFQVNHRDYEVGSALDMEMGRVVGENPAFYATHLNEAYKIAKANLSSSDIDSRIEQARREERDRLTRKSALSQPQSQATAPVAVASIRTAAEAERFINTASKEDYNAKLPELQAALGIELRPRK